MYLFAFNHTLSRRYCGEGEGKAKHPYQVSNCRVGATLLVPRRGSGVMTLRLSQDQRWDTVLSIENLIA